MYSLILWRVLVTFVAMTKQKNNIFCAPACMQCECTIASTATCLAVQYSSTLSHKVTIFVRSYWTQNVFWFSLQLCLKRFSSLEELSEMWSNLYIGLHVQYPLFLSDCNETGIFSTDFGKILKHQAWNPSDRTIVLRSTQPLTEMSIRSISAG